MNILIVDDNASNRVVLKLFLEDFESKNQIKFNVKEAVDGLEAIRMCEDEKFDIVFMDIMMPKMDGIQATKLIREHDKGIMIIAISAVDDHIRQKEILSNGAEDYISKPVSLDIFTSRISSYISLIESRQRKEKSESVRLFKVNLFSNKIYSRQIVFIIDSEDSLSEFWEYFLLNNKTKYDNLSDLVRIIYSVVEAQLNISIKPKIYIEESDSYQYFTLDKVNKLPSKVLNLILNKNPSKSEYRIKKEKISFKLSKVYFVDKEKINLKKESQTQEIDIKSKELKVFNYIDEDDLIDLEEYANKLNTLMLIVGNEDVTKEEIVEIYSYLEKIGSVLNTYSEVYVISKALTNLSQDLAIHINEFMEYSNTLGPMCSAFSSDLSTWIKMSFYTGAPSVDFMNDTISVNCDTISGMLKMDEQDDSNSGDIDDIFDF
ncbi:MAG: response regulator [Sulfurimonas sp.]|nr:response regulator [Sulfurimonas sp.]